MLLDLPPLDGHEDDARPLAAIAASPWRAYDLSAGPDVSALSVRATATEPATLGETLALLPAGPLWRWDAATALDVRLDFGALVSRTAAEVLAGANALAVLRPNGEAEIVQFAIALPLGGGAWRLSMLLRDSRGRRTRRARPSPRAPPSCSLDADLVRAQLGGSERGLPLTWRAAPARRAGGGPRDGGGDASPGRESPGGPGRPSHLRASQGVAEGSTLSWIRRARVHSDGWDAADPPLGEETESYRVQVLSGDPPRCGSGRRRSPQALYAAADLAADFPAARLASLTVRVAQGSAIYGWGVPAQRTLWL